MMQPCKKKIGPERRLALRLAHASVPSVGVWQLSGLSGVSHQTAYSIIGKASHSGLVDALPAIRTKWIEEAGTDEFEPWVRALIKALPSAFLTVAGALPDNLRPAGVPGVCEKNLDTMIALHATNPGQVEASLIEAIEKLESHFDKLGRLIAAQRRNTEVKAA